MTDGVKRHCVVIIWGSPPYRVTDGVKRHCEVIIHHPDQQGSFLTYACKEGCDVTACKCLEAPDCLTQSAAVAVAVADQCVAAGAAVVVA